MDPGLSDSRFLVLHHIGLRHAQEIPKPWTFPQTSSGSVPGISFYSITKEKRYSKARTLTGIIGGCLRLDAEGRVISLYSFYKTEWRELWDSFSREKLLSFLYVFSFLILASIRHWEWQCYGLNICVSLKLHIEALAPNMIVSGVGAFGRQLSLAEVMRVESPL